MSDDAMQGLLFAGSGDQPTVDDRVADTELRLCTLNINSPSPARAQRLVDWLAATCSNALVLTEVQAGPACDLIRTTSSCSLFRKLLSTSPVSSSSARTCICLICAFVSSSDLTP